MAVTAGTNFEYYTVSGNEPNTDLGSSPVCALFEKRGCPHCDNFRPTWEKFKQSNTDGKVAIESFEASEHPDVMSKHNIQGFPTVRLYPNGMNGEHKEFNGERNIESLQSFIGGGVFGGGSLQNGDEDEIQSTIATNDIQGSADNIEGFSEVEYFDVNVGCDRFREERKCNSNIKCTWNNGTCRAKLSSSEKMAPMGILNEMGGDGNDIGQVDTATDRM